MRLPAFSQTVFSPASMRLLRISALVIATAILFSACSKPDSELLGSQSDSTRAGAAVDVQAILGAMLEPASQDAAAKALAAEPEPRAKVRTAVRNLHQPSLQDTIEVREYDGALVEVYEVGATGATFIKSVTVFGSAQQFMGLTVGMPMSDAVQLLAASGARPVQGNDNLYFIGKDRLAPAQISLEGENGHLAAYTVSGYLD